MRFSIFGLLLACVSFVAARSATGNKLLVVLEDEADKASYTQFWTDLGDRGFQITYRTPKDSSLSLFQHGEPAYSHLLLLPTKSKGLGPALTPNLLVDFVNAGSNVLLALSANTGVPVAVSSLLLELDIHTAPDRNSVVVDHFNYDAKSATEAHDVLLLSTSNSKSASIKNFFSVDGLVAFPHTVGQVLGNASPLLASVMQAPNTAYTYNPKDDSGEGMDDVYATGAQLNLVSAFQARNSARFTVLGSAEALEDSWFDANVQLSSAGDKKANKSGNRAFAHKLSAWTFKESGVLRVNTINHYLNEGSQKDVKDLTNIDLNPGIYRIKNNVHYSASLSEWAADHWAPFTLPSTDKLQLEVSMLSPFHRLNLSPSQDSANSTAFTAEFPLPDQHGIFNFFLSHRRPFYTNIEEKRTVTVRHFAHDEWPRSFVISAAWPWIGGIGVTVAGWLGFVALWLYSQPAQPQRDLKR